MNYLKIHWTCIHFANIFYRVKETYYILFFKPCSASSDVYPGWPGSGAGVGSGVGTGIGSGIGSGVGSGVSHHDEKRLETLEKIDPQSKQDVLQEV